MVRSILSVVAGYAAMAIGTMILFGVLGAIDPARFGRELKASPGAGALIVILAGGLVAAIAGGYVTAWIARGSAPAHVVALVVVIIVLGVVSGMSASYPDDTPSWYLVGIPVVGIAGALLGGLVLAGGRTGQAS
jgi:hypothetical protein